uniref:Uncharacterized protein n=1 Tax=Nelumbo nucifera TaxID=4432 RepID=A0A822ZNC3_NELNU|nr:TPA_asm: hypothetical protein HUJ06_004503 [Nelumbo nucifera]
MTLSNYTTNPVTELRELQVKEASWWERGGLREWGLAVPQQNLLIMNVSSWD